MDAKVAAGTVTGDAGQVGQWGPVVDWPVVAVHMALLPNGKVLAYDSMGDNATESYPVQDHTRATVWDPATGSQTPVNVTTGYNIFCSGLAHLMDGSLFVAGGTKDPQFDGLVQTHIFHPDTNAWSLGPNMAAGRWYPSVTPLSNGETLITSGGPDMPEVRKIDGGLRALNTASLSLPLYPWMDVAPNGRAFDSGPDQTMRSLDTAGGGSWQDLGQRDTLYRDYGSHALYDVGKILVAGGGSSSNDARVIDVNGGTPQVSATAPMAYGRRQHNLTVLADGTVLATGGNSSGAALVDLNNGVYPAELWNPATGQWQTLAAMQVTRQYHSTALLLPDGRVLSAGGGICGTCDSVGYLAKNAEVFSPPYLFKKDGSGELAPRPQITSAPDHVSYNAPLAISTPDAASISKVALVRLGAVTHSVNMEQRYVPLSFTAGSGTVNATAPANANVAPPGVYMLFVIGADGVPSVASMVRVDTSPTVSFVGPAENAVRRFTSSRYLVELVDGQDVRAGERVDAGRDVAAERGHDLAARRCAQGLGALELVAGQPGVLAGRAEFGGEQRQRGTVRVVAGGHRVTPPHNRPGPVTPSDMTATAARAAGTTLRPPGHDGQRARIAPFPVRTPRRCPPSPSRSPRPSTLSRP